MYQTKVDKIYVRQPSSKAGIAGRSSFMVLAIGFGPKPQPYVICTASITEYSQILGAAYDLSTHCGVSKSVMHAWKEKMTEKTLSQMNKSEYIEIKNAWKEIELLHNNSSFLEMELWRLKFHVLRGILCTAHAQRAFLHVDRLYLVTHVSSGDGKGSFFSVLIALSCGVNNFIQEELLILMIFTL